MEVTVAGEYFHEKDRLSLNQWFFNDSKLARKSVLLWHCGVDVSYPRLSD